MFIFIIFSQTRKLFLNKVFKKNGQAFARMYQTGRKIFRQTNIFIANTYQI